MTFSRYAGSLAIASTLLLLAGCPGRDDAMVESGLTIHLAETHLEERAPSAVSTLLLARGLNSTATSNVSIKAVAPGNAATASVLGGYDTSNIEHHDMTDNSGHLVSVYRAYVVLDEFQLVRCTSLSELPRMLLDSIIPTAQAHAGHGAEPVGGRSLDDANVIDIVTQDEYILALGDMAAAPGQYCGVRVSLAPAHDDAYGRPEPAAASNDDPTTTAEIPDLVGKAFAMRADYCSTPAGAGGCLGRSKIDIDDTGLTFPDQQTMTFAQPLEIGGSVRHAYIAVGIAYGEWMHDVNAAILSSDLNERQKLFNNIASSLHVYSKGLGDLPANIAP